MSNVTVSELMDKIHAIREMSPEEFEAEEAPFQQCIIEAFEGRELVEVSAFVYALFLHVLEVNPLEAIRLWNTFRTDIRETLTSSIANGLSEFLGGKVTIKDATISVSS